MKRKDFKLLIENWRKNFIVESPEDDGVQHELGSDDYNYFYGSSDDMSDGYEDEDLLSNTGDLHSMPSNDTRDDEFKDDSFEDRGIYDNDPPTEDYEDSDEFGYMPMPGVDSGYEDDDHNREIDEDPEEYGF